ncbi:MarR family transcriptional regulator [Myxococcota bacterium]|nr:MarR family transcriptional regulator [Myxococcota bacterium]
MDPTEQDQRERLFVEEVGLMLEQVGLPRMAGRILGRLLISQPDHQSSAELAEYLHASKASISTSTRLLQQVGLIQRVPVAGSRESWFAVRPDTYDGLLQAELVKTRMARELMDRGLLLLADRPPRDAARLRQLRDLYAFFERELPTMLAKWHTTKEPR